MKFCDKDRPAGSDEGSCRRPALGVDVAMGFVASRCRLRCARPRVRPGCGLRRKAFVFCRACHQIGPGAKIAVGPVFNGVVGRKAGTYPGYAYSDANKNSGLTWDEATLQKYPANPQAVVKGTKMVFPGLKDPAKVNDVIAYLKTFKADGSAAN